jgi:hypothetical protein
LLTEEVPASQIDEMNESGTSNGGSPEALKQLIFGRFLPSG